MPIADDEQPPPELEALPAHYGDHQLARLVPADIGARFWTRALVDTGPHSSQIRLFFDRGTHQSGKQRGWVDCSHHECIRYVFCDHSKLEMAAEMLAWERAGATLADKSIHLAFKPPC